MKTKLLLTLISAMLVVACVGCGTTSDTPETTEIAADTPIDTPETTEVLETTETLLEQTPVEETTEDTTPEAETTSVTYTYTDMDATMYAQQTVNVRDLPDTTGEKLGGLSTNDEVKVTGQCNETNWYRIEFDGNVAYVSDSYLSSDKVTVQASNSDSTQTAPNTIKSTAESANYPNITYVNVCAGSVSYPGSNPYRSLGKCPYPLGVVIDNGDGTHTLYSVRNHGGHLNGAWIDFTPQGEDALPKIGLYSADCYPYDEGCVHKWVW